MRLDSFPTIDVSAVGWITEQQMVEVDRVMTEDLHIELLQMMENAGRNLARAVLDVYAPGRVSVLSGPGGNGGGGLVAARHLANAGVDVVVATTRQDNSLSPAAAHQFDILRRMGIATTSTPIEADVIIDALIGYSLRGAPRGSTAELISHTTESEVPVVSLDNPSGLDVTTGETPGAVVEADVTVTLALPKIGLRSAPQVGALLLADISVPRSVTGALGPAAPDFSAGPLLRVTGLPTE
jgi:NAD(P)H-hydrate epimerase